MVIKKRLSKFTIWYVLAVALFFILMVNGASALLSCNVQQNCNQIDPRTQFGVVDMMDNSNWNMHLDNRTGWYPPRGGYTLCCNSTGANITSNCTTPRAAVIAKAYDPSNTHMEFNYLNNYQYDMCISSPTAFYNCTVRNSTCTARETCMFSFSSDTNAHIGTCDTYETHVCCRDDDMDHDEYSDYDRGEEQMYDDYDDCDDTDRWNNPRRVRYYCPRCTSAELTYAEGSVADSDPIYNTDCHFDHSSLINSTINSSTVVKSTISNVTVVDSVITDSRLSYADIRSSVIKSTIIPCKGLIIRGTIENNVLKSGTIQYLGSAYSAPFSIQDICAAEEPFGGELKATPSALMLEDTIFFITYDSKGKTGIDVTADISQLNAAVGSVDLRDDGEYPDVTPNDGIYSAHGISDMFTEGGKTIFADVTDKSGATERFNTTIIADNVSPNATIIINNDEELTVEPQVELQMNYYDQNGLRNCRVTSSNLTSLAQRCDFEIGYQSASADYMYYKCEHMGGLDAWNHTWIDEGYSGKGIHITGSQSLNTTDFGQLPVSTPRGTMQFKFKPDWDGNDGKQHIMFADPLFYTNPESFSSGFMLFKSTGNDFVFAWANMTHIRTINASAAEITHGTWHDIAITWKNGTAGTQEAVLYIDGVVGAANRQASAFPSASSQVMYIGGYRQDGGNMTIDDWMVWTYPKTVSDITHDHDAWTEYGFSVCKGKETWTLPEPVGKKTVYYEVVDTAGNFKITKDRILYTVGFLPVPKNLTVTDDGDFTNSHDTLHARWHATTEGAGTIRYTYRVYDVSAATYLTEWIDAGNYGTDEEATLYSLELQNNHTYYFEVFALNANNITDDNPSRSDGIITDWGPPGYVSITSPTHSNDTISVDQDPILEWIADDNVSGIYGYSYLLTNKESSSRPDNIAEVFGMDVTLVENNTVWPDHKADVAVNSKGDRLVVWQGGEGSDSDIYGKMYDAFGASIGPEFKISDSAVGQQLNPKAAVFAKNSFVVVYETPDSSGSGIGLKIVQSDRSMPYPEVIVNEHTTSNQIMPAVAGYDGGYTVIWSSELQGGSHNSTYAKRFLANGSSITPPATEQGTGTGDEFEVYSDSVYNAIRSDIDHTKDGGFVVVFESTYTISNNPDIIFRAYNRTGDTVSSPTMAHAAAGGNQIAPSISISGPGTNFVITWATDSGAYDTDGFGIEASVFDTDTYSGSPEFGVNTETTEDQVFPDVDFGLFDSYAIAWTDRNLNTTKLQIFSLTANDKVGPETNLSRRIGTQSNVSIAFDSDTSIFTVWADTAGKFGEGTYASMRPVLFRQYEALQDNTYYFFIRAIDFAGNVGPSSEFKLILNAMSPDSPAFSHGDMYSTTGMIQFNWTMDEDTSNPVQEYEMRYDIDSSFSAPTVMGTGSTAKYYSVNFGATEEDYYVQVRSIALNGATSSWSDEIMAHVDSTPPTFSDIIPTDSSTVLTAYPKLIMSTSENCDGEYTFDSWIHVYPFTVTGTRYHESKSSVYLDDGIKTIQYRCRDPAGNVGYGSAMTVDIKTAADIGFVYVGTSQPIYARTLTNISVEVEDGSLFPLAGISNERFALYVDGGATDFSLDDIGDGRYQMLFKAPKESGMHKVYVAIDEDTFSTEEDANVLPVKLRIGFGTGTDSRDNLIYSSGTQGVFGIASDTEKSEANATDQAISASVGDNAFIFVTRPQAQLENLDRYLERQNLLDQPVPTFGYEIERDVFDITSSLQYDEIYIEGTRNMPPGRYKLVVINAGKITSGPNAGKDRILIRIE